MVTDAKLTNWSKPGYVWVCAWNWLWKTPVIYQLTLLDMVSPFFLIHSTQEQELQEALWGAAECKRDIRWANIVYIDIAYLALKL